MRLIRHPWIWFMRFRQRKGYGVHSPFAYSFIRGVVLETSPYYAYSELARLHPWWVRWGGLYPMACRRLLFRLANFAEPQTMRLLTVDKVAAEYIRAAVPRAEVLDAKATDSAGKAQSRGADFVFVGKERLKEAHTVAAEMPERGMLVCEGIHDNKEAFCTWRAIQEDGHTGITFDLYTYGVAFFNHKLHKQHYKVNF